MIWVILGATSAISKAFSHLAASEGHGLILVGRSQKELDIIATDLRLRYHTSCDCISIDLAADISPLLNILQHKKEEIALFIAASTLINNAELDSESTETLIRLNVLNTIMLISLYLKKEQKTHRLIFLSSVAACRGRAKNSLYGASKAFVEVYLQGLQQRADKNATITIARLGFIDTVQTFGLPHIFYASSPEQCAKACWLGSVAGKRFLYHPFFWRYIMIFVTRLPFFLYRRLMQ